MTLSHSFNTIQQPGSLSAAPSLYQTSHSMPLTPRATSLFLPPQPLASFLAHLPHSTVFSDDLPQHQKQQPPIYQSERTHQPRISRCQIPLALDARPPPTGTSRPQASSMSKGREHRASQMASILQPVAMLLAKLDVPDPWTLMMPAVSM